MRQVRSPSRRWLGAAFVIAIPVLTACGINDDPDGWAPPIETEVERSDGSTVSVILVRTGDNRIAAIDLTSLNPIVWEFPGTPSGQPVAEDNVFPGILTEIDAKGFYGVPTPIGPQGEEFVIADHDDGIVYALRRDGTSARVILDTEDRVIAGIVVDPDGRTIYVSTTDARVYALDTENPPRHRDDTERLRWLVTDLDGKVWGTPALVETDAHGLLLLVPTTNGTVIALRTDDSNVAWSFRAGAGIASDIVVRGGLAYVGAFDRQLYALDVETGEPRWTQTGDDWFWTKALIVDGALYVGDLAGNVWAWDALTGAPLWAVPYNTDERIRAQPVLTPAGDLVIVTREGHVLALDPSSGAKIWASRDADLKVENRVLATPLVQADDRILLNDDQGELWESRVGVNRFCRVWPRSSTTCSLSSPGDPGAG